MVSPDFNLICKPAYYSSSYIPNDNLEYVRMLNSTLSVAAEEGDYLTVEKLLQMGADVDARDKNGRTPLMMAASRGHTEVAKLLLLNGADVSATNKRNETAFDLARNHPQTRNVLHQFKENPVFYTWVWRWQDNLTLSTQIIPK